MPQWSGIATLQTGGSGEHRWLTRVSGRQERPSWKRPLRLLQAAGLACGCALPGVAANAAVLKVGPNLPYQAPSAAIAAAHDGDTVLIAPGTYYDCAIVRQNHLVIAGAAPGVVLTDKACAGKALLVLDGRDITVRDLALARARVPDGNGAGIRAEGHNLTVDHVSFVNNQDGILAADDQSGTLTVKDSLFRRNGSCGPRCGHAINVGRLGLLRVEGSTFQQAVGGNHISSAARSTELFGNRMTDESGQISGPLVSVSGGALSLVGNTVTLGSDTSRLPGAILITGDATQITVRGNKLLEPADQKTALLRNWTGRTASVGNNAMPPGVAAVSDNGEIYHRLGARLAALRNTLRAAAGHAKRLLFAHY